MITMIPTRAAVWYVVRELPGAIAGFMVGFFGAARDTAPIGRRRRGG